MPCNPLTDPACIITKVIPPVTGTLTGGVLTGIADAIREGVRWIVVNTATWWIRVPSPDLASQPSIIRIQSWLLPITAAVAIGGVIGAGVRMTLTRRANPLLDVSGGLLSLAAAVTLGVVVPTLLLRAGDAWSSWVLQASTGGHFTERLAAVMSLGGKAAPAVVLVFGIVAIVLALVQAALMLFRQIALIVLAGVLPLAAAGTVAPLTRPWIRRITSWMLALICYKPAAAAVYAVAFTMIGSGHGVRAVLMGFVTLLLSVVALPVLMRLFTWTTGSIGGADGGGQLLNAVAFGAVAIGAMRSGSGGGAASAAQDQAAYLNTRLGPLPGSSPPSGAAGPSGPVGPTGAPASSAASAGTSSGAAASTATGAAAAAGPVGAAAAGAVDTARSAADTTSRLAEGAMGPEGEE